MEATGSATQPEEPAGAATQPVEPDEVDGVEECIPYDEDAYDEDAFFGNEESPQQTRKRGETCII